MSNIFDSLQQTIRNNAPQRRGGPSIDPAANLQTIDNPILWDWPTDSVGNTSQEMYNFCDKIPTSSTDKKYIAGSNSFSQGYSNFLDLLVQKRFPLKSALKTSKALNKPEGDLYPNGPIPKYWTNVQNITSTDDLARAYNISNYPSDWISKMKASGGNALELSTDKGIIVDTNGSTIDNSKIQFGLKAEAWGNITISTEGWYDGTLVKIAESNNGPYKSHLDNSAVFGEQGFLPCRVASFIVALNPSTYIKMAKSMNSTLLDGNNIHSIQVAGFSFNINSSNENKKEAKLDSIISNITTAGNTTTLVADAKSNSDMAYIIAVQLECFN